MHFSKSIAQRLGVDVLASNRRPFAIETYSITDQGGSTTISICATNPYSNATWWWLFTLGPAPARRIVAVETDGLEIGRAVSRRDSVPGNIMDLALSLASDLRKDRRLDA